MMTKGHLKEGEDHLDSAAEGVGPEFGGDQSLTPTLPPTTSESPLTPRVDFLTTPETTSSPY